ncbi:MAG: hypothetical protein ACREQY_11715, partial [Candidatus Binatia bacterium]
VSVGPTTVAPADQGKGVGRALLQSVIDREPKARSMRLMQDSLNLASFELLVRLGYALGEEVAMLTLPAGFREDRESDPEVRPATADDLEGVLEMDRRLAGSDRRKDFELLRRFGKVLVLHSGRELRGYLAQMPTPGRTMLGPGGAEEPESLLRLSLHAVAETLGELSLLLPAWSRAGVCPLLDAGFRLVGLTNLMFRGEWQEPRGAYTYSLFPESH